jgi:hypothetical protein
MKVKKFAAFVFAFVLFAFALELSAIEIPGSYKFQGFDPFINKEYSGKATITKNGKIYNARWEFANGEVYTGTGLELGDQVAFVFKSTQEGKCGIQVYRVEGEALIGDWTFIGEDKVGREILKKSE